MNDQLVYFIIFSIILSLCIIDLIICILINLEEKKQKRILVLPYFIFFIILIINLILSFILYFNFTISSLVINQTKNLTSIYLIETLHFFSDSDKDGENILWGNDPDNHNLHIRSEGKYSDNYNVNLLNSNLNNMDYYIITLFFNEGKYNPQIHRIAPSNKTPIILFSLFNNISTYEFYLYNASLFKKNLQSIFSILSQNYYRTICSGYDANQNYYTTKALIRIDRGCEIFLPYHIENQINPIENFLSFLDYTQKQYKNYSESKNVIWIHYDFTKDVQIDKNKILSLIENKIPFPSNMIKNNRYIILIFYLNPIPHYEVLTNIENTAPLTNKKFSNYGILFRIIYYSELRSLHKEELKILQDLFFIKEYEFSKNKNLNHYNFIEPDDYYWKELIHLLEKPVIPPISILEKNKEIQIYDGRTGNFIEP
ncbi:MAG: hypothetical protein KatS3mg129_1037 [Leptospiraceae bacterium]|nr:MAG: hypothetical protein KatS3mg129_1037 [Leptospiraceae bacterium]